MLRYEHIFQLITAQVSIGVSAVASVGIQLVKSEAREATSQTQRVVRRRT